MKTFRIAYLTETSPNDKHAWSGTVHYIYEALKNEGHVVMPLGPEHPKLIGFICKVINQVSLKILNKRFDYRHSAIYTKAFGKLFAKKLANIQHDIIVVCGGTEYCAYLKTPKPLFIILDRTIEGALNYHSILSNLLDFSKKQSIASDKKAMLQATKVFFSSEWAANHAKKYYNLSDIKLQVIPFGANLDKIPAREIVLKEKKNTEINLLFIGTDWKNKGADIAINTLNKLLKQNIKTHLTIVGCTPPENSNYKNLTVIPFIDKNTESGINDLWQLFLSHHLFILPTRFDCTPIVFCEASSFGVPVLTSNTGGVKGHIKEGINGFLIPYEDDGTLFAEKISEIFFDKTKMHELSLSSRNFYEETLNWKVWAKKFTEEVNESV